VQITKTVNYQGMEPPTIDFDISTPELDPLDGSPLYEPQLQDLRYYIEQGDDLTTQEVIDAFNQSNPQAGAMTIKEVDDFLISKNEKLDDFLENFAKDQYFENPFELVEVKSVGEIAANIPDQTFAFGNDEVGYQLFIGGKRVTDPDNVAYSRAEAQIQLQNKLSEGGDPLRTVDEDPFYGPLLTGDAQYKSYIDETLPGGSNYREVVFRYENAPEPHSVTTHFDDDQALASALIRDRKLDDGVETLHVDELQSDLHTEGSKYGYKAPTKIKEKTLEDLDDFLKDKENYYVAYKDGKDGLRDRVKQEFISFTDIDYISELTKQKEVTRFGSDKADELVKYMGKDFDRLVEIIQPISKEGTTPNYPFKDDWYVMSLKQLIKDAIDEGKDAISVSGSAPIKARYTDQYSKFYESLYDQKIPSAMKKLANKYGGKFEKGGLNKKDTFGEGFSELAQDLDNLTPLQKEAVDKDLTFLEANIIRITPEMRAKIAEEGLPTFAFGGAVETPMRLTMPEDVNIFADAQFTQNFDRKNCKWHDRLSFWSDY
jgi:hypothetical protein